MEDLICISTGIVTELESRLKPIVCSDGESITPSVLHEHGSEIDRIYIHTPVLVVVNTRDLQAQNTITGFRCVFVIEIRPDDMRIRYTGAEYKNSPPKLLQLRYEDPRSIDTICQIVENFQLSGIDPNSHFNWEDLGSHPLKFNFGPTCKPR